MYNPSLFREDRPEILHAILREARLAILVSAGADGVPEATHVPLQLAADEGPHGTLYGHLARANTHWRGLAAAGRARAIFMGPEAYVSPSFYASKQEHGKVVPTWNYVAVHAIGAIDVFEDATRLHALVDRLTNHHEAPRAKPWVVDDAPEAFIASQLKGIVGLRLEIETLIGKRKLSQNRPEQDQHGVIEGLGSSEDARDRDVAALMQRGS